MKKIPCILLFKHGVICEKILGKEASKEVTVRSYSLCRTTKAGDCKPKKVDVCSEPSPRGCLPWETQQQKLEKEAKDECKDCKPRSLFEKLTKSICERRRIAKCMRVTRDPEKCRDLLGDIQSTKVYPALQAVRKSYIPGCPDPNSIHLNQQWSSSSDNGIC